MEMGEAVDGVDKAHEGILVLRKFWISILASASAELHAKEIKKM